MCKKVVLLTSLIMAVLTSVSLAADVSWTNGTGDGLWTTAGNWNPPYLPEIAYQDKAKINRMDGPLISDGMAAQCQWLALGDGSPAAMHMTGGTLNVSGTGDSWTIIAYGPADVATLTVDGGAIATSNRVFVGFQGSGTIVMNGGTFNIGGTFGIGYGEAAFNTGRGYVYLNGGNINVSGTFIMSSPAGALGRLDVSGGTLTLTGDKRTTVNGYVNAGYIVSFNGMGIVNVAYDGTNTIVTGQMNPNIARVPQPANNAAGVAPYAALGWMAGDTATAQDIYFGTDETAVLSATPSTAGIYRGTQAADNCAYIPAGLERGTKYYWRIDSFADPNTYKGNLWQFTVADFALVEDFESYADSAALLASWANPVGGGALSLAAAGGHDAAKALKFDYDNSGAGGKAYYSEAQTAGPTANWMIAGVKAVDIWYKGAVSNTVVPMYAALEDNNGNAVAVVVNDRADAVVQDQWTVWRIDLADFAGVNLQNVKTFYVGFGDRANPAAGGTGTVYFDDIALFPPRCLFEVTGDLTNDCFVDLNDFTIMAENWLGVSGL
ncbi:MAG: hypothetical protein LLF76_13720 [Planctomycetaceae bacterium]|nr:hypothetical protein [Planctomycetaceae bacterium]